MKNAINTISSFACLADSGLHCLRDVDGHQNRRTIDTALNEARGYFEAIANKARAVIREECPIERESSCH